MFLYQDAELKTKQEEGNLFRALTHHCTGLYTLQLLRLPISSIPVAFPLSEFGQILLHDKSIQYEPFLNLQTFPASLQELHVTAEIFALAKVPVAWWVLKRFFQTLDERILLSFPSLTSLNIDGGLRSVILFLSHVQAPSITSLTFNDKVDGEFRNWYTVKEGELLREFATAVGCHMGASLTRISLEIYLHMHLDVADRLHTVVHYLRPLLGLPTFTFKNSGWY